MTKNKAADLAQGYGELHVGDAIIPLPNVPVDDRHPGCRVIIADPAIRIVVAQVRANRVAQINPDGLTLLLQAITCHRHGNQLRRFSGGEGQRPAGRAVVDSLGRVPLPPPGPSCPVHGYLLRTGRAQGHRELHVGGAAVSLPNGARIVDRQRRGTVVVDDPTPALRLGDLCIGRVAQPHLDQLIGSLR